MTPPASSEPTRTVTGEGWRASGKVETRGPAPVAGARVRLAWISAEGAESILGSALADAGGRWDARLPALDALEPLRAGGAWITARIEADGFQPASLRRALEAGLAQRAIVLDARLTPGSTLRGRAIDAQDRPVAHARAHLYTKGPPGGSADLVACGEVETDPNGAFALGFVSSASYRLLVRADGVGMHAQDLALEAAKDRDLGDVRLSGGDALEGSVRTLHGEPVAELELWAIEGSLAFKPESFATAVRLAPRSELGDGLSFARTFTDAEGRFRFGGLRPQHYAILSPDPAVVLEPRQGRWEPGQHGAELEMHSARILVHVVGPDGAPVPGAVVTCTDLSFEEDGSFAAGDARREVARGPRAAIGFSVDPETPVAIAARAPGASSEERVVFLGQGAHYSRETLALRARGDGGRIRFVLGGDAPPGPIAFRALLLSPTTGVRDEATGELEADEAGLVRGVPPGEHRLLVEIGGEGGRWYFPWSSDSAVRVAEGGETRVLVTPVVGCRLRVRCEQSGPPAPGYEESRTGEKGRDAAQHRDLYGLRLWIEPAGGGPSRPVALSQGDAPLTAILPGESAESTGLFGPGDWIVHAESTIWRAGEWRVRLVAGRDNDVLVEARSR